MGQNFDDLHRKCFHYELKLMGEVRHLRVNIKTACVKWKGE